VFLRPDEVHFSISAACNAIDDGGVETLSSGLVQAHTAYHDLAQTVG